MPKKFLWISCTLILISSCVDQTFDSRGSLDWDYLPLKLGEVSTYEIVEINYLGRGVTPEENSYLLREEIIEKQLFPDGSILYTLSESKLDSFGIWKPWRYYLLRKEYDQVISTIENLETVEIKLPLLNGGRWEARATLSPCPDGGTYCDFFEVANKNQGFNSAGISYPNTVKIERQNTVDPLKISTDYIEFGIYAQGSGLIYMETIYLEYASCRNGQNADCCCANNSLCTLCSGEVEFGFRRTKTLLERTFAN